GAEQRRRGAPGRGHCRARHCRPPRQETGSQAMKKLLGAPLHVVNIGIASFAEPVRRAGGSATQLEWAPPAQGDRAVADSLARLIRHPTVETANKKAFEAYGAASPVLDGIGL